MLTINQNYLNLENNYLFATVGKKVNAFVNKNPDRQVIRLGIGDVTLPLCPAVTEALHAAVDEMGRKETFHGYGPYEGYPFLRNAIRDYYDGRGVSLQSGEIFISDGAKSDVSNILDILSKDNTVLIPDPVYPVYVDTNVMDGRKIFYMDAGEHNGFLPPPSADVRADIIYLCSPGNPTGAVYTAAGLKAWVDYALERNSLILFDAAYEAFVCDKTLPRSIFEIEGARSCAIEFNSLSKTAGFTGTRCGYAIVPYELIFAGQSLRDLWLRRQTTKFNGVSYIVQKGAAAIFSPDGQTQVRQAIDYYRANARTMTDALGELGIWFTGGDHSPYVWLKCPRGMDSWSFFDFLLEKACVVGTPGAGFGKNGEGFFRFSAFGDKQATIEAMRRVKEVLA